MERKWLVLGLGGLAAIVGTWIAADLLIETDRERIERFVDDVTGRLDATRIDAALRWTDPATVPLEVNARGVERLYTGDDAQDLRHDARSALSRFYGEELRSLSTRIEIEDDRAGVDLRLLTGRGMANVSYTLTKRGERWLLSKLRVSR